MAVWLRAAMRARCLCTGLRCSSPAGGRYDGTQNRSKKSNEDFVIRRANSLDDLQWVTKMAVEEGWSTRKREAESYFMAGITPNFLIGELNGERISCMSVVRHGESLAFLGSYMVDKPYRGQGYGPKTWEAALASVGDQCNCLGVAVVNMLEQYRKVGLEPGWIVRRYAFTVSRALEGFASSQMPPSVNQILPASQADFEKLFVYGADMLGTSQVCRSMLAAWLAHAQESSWVALGNKGEVVGYLIMSETARFSEDGYRIAPFFADSAPIARSLLKVAADFASANNASQMILDIAAEFNVDGVRIMENEIGARTVDNYALVFTKELPNKCHIKMYGIGSGEIL